MRPQILFVMLSILILESGFITGEPNLSKKEDLKALGLGKIIEKDGTRINKINLVEINDVAVVYIKDDSLHDMAISQVARIEFMNSKWGALQIVFINEKPKIIYLN